jgi:hypothetical protein
MYAAAPAQRIVNLLRVAVQTGITKMSASLSQPDCEILGRADRPAMTHDEESGLRTESVTSCEKRHPNTARLA